MYGNGGSEELVAEVIAGRREQIYLVSKVLPENASRRGTIAACEHSLKRLRTDYLDMYLLHWRGSVPLEETLEAFTTLRDRGSIRHYGVSNFDRRRPRGSARRYRAAPTSRRIKCCTTSSSAASSGTSCRGAANAACR